MSRETAAPSTVAQPQRYTLTVADQIVPVDQWSTLEQTIRSLPTRSAEPNAIATLTSSAGNALSIGIAGPGDGDNPGLSEQVACLTYIDASGDPPYLTVVGDASMHQEDGGIVVFKFNGHWTEMLRRNCLSIELMLPVVKEFFRTGQLPRNASWEEV